MRLVQKAREVGAGGEQGRRARPVRALSMTNEQVLRQRSRATWTAREAGVGAGAAVRVAREVGAGVAGEWATHGCDDTVGASPRRG
jgi:hypothetical protein